MSETDSFIAAARRDQIIEATIKTLDELGYVDTSLAQIAKRSSISTALISYHFANKTDLMHHVLERLMAMWQSFVMERTEAQDAPQKKLEAFILSSLEYQAKHPAHNFALFEIVFNSRLDDGTPLYKLADESEDPLFTYLCTILDEGQKAGVFTSFQKDTVATLIQGSISEYNLSAIAKKIRPEEYGKQIVSHVFRIVEKV